MISHPDVGRPVPRTEASLTLNLAKKKAEEQTIQKESGRTIRGFSTRLICDKNQQTYINMKRARKKGSYGKEFQSSQIRDKSRKADRLDMLCRPETQSTYG